MAVMMVTGSGSAKALTNSISPACAKPSMRSSTVCSMNGWVRLSTDLLNMCLSMSTRYLR